MNSPLRTAAFASFGVVGLVFTLLALTPNSVAHAEAQGSPACPELPCSVLRSCSSTGVACRPDDRSCTERARGNDLEVKCEQACDDGSRLIYCPPDTGRSDSRVVWILLAVALLLTVVGSSLLVFIFKKKQA